MPQYHPNANTVGIVSSGHAVSCPTNQQKGSVSLCG